MLTKAKALARIARNIRAHGVHLYLVSGSSHPRFAYTIGLHAAQGFELVLAGGIHYLGDEVTDILNGLAARLRAGKARSRPHPIPELGSFTLRKAHASWTRRLLLGAVDYYKTDSIIAYQVVPDDAHWTIDVPDLSRAWDPAAEPVWATLADAVWPLAVPEGSVAATDLAALRGARITEACRWDPDYWEMFATPGPDVTREATRIVSLTTLLAVDPSLRPVLDLAVGTGIRRDPKRGVWVPWQSKASEDET